MKFVEEKSHLCVLSRKVEKRMNFVALISINLCTFELGLVLATWLLCTPNCDSKTMETDSLIFILFLAATTHDVKIPNSCILIVILEAKN